MLPGERRWLFAAGLFFAIGAGLYAQETATQERELIQQTVQRVRDQNRALQESLRHRDTVIRELTKNLVIARTECELFRKKWTDARLRLESLAGDVADGDRARLQQELVDSARSHHVAEAARQQLAVQLRRLVAAVESGAGVESELARARESLRIEEQVAGDQRQRSPVSSRAAEATLHAAQVLDVNLQLQLVVLDVGARHGARVGMPFVVWRDGRVIAELRVVEVRAMICGALIEKADSDRAVVAGDAARVTKS